MWWFNPEKIPTELHKFYWRNQKVVEYWEHSYLHGWRQMDPTECDFTWKSGMPYHLIEAPDEDYVERLHKHPMVQW
jgi:hypothetical protein